MKNFFQKLCCDIKRQNDSNKLKSYTIKFKKVKLDEQIDFILGDSWSEKSNNAVYKLLTNYFAEDEDIVIKQIFARNASHTSYIKFKATISGYNKVFSLFTNEDVAKSLKILSAYKP